MSEQVQRRPDSDPCAACGEPWRECVCLGPRRDAIATWPTDTSVAGSVDGEGEVEKIIRDLFPEAHGFSKRFVLSEIAKLRTRLAEAEREREAMRRVVEAAERWRERTAPDWLFPHEAPLRKAVDEYRARRTG